jgi:hypothetical protein
MKNNKFLGTPGHESQRQTQAGDPLDGYPAIHLKFTL